jgi:ankyrin repeat protein
MVRLKVALSRKHWLSLGMLVVLACVLAGTRANAQANDLINAADKGNLPRVKASLAAKADVNARFNNGATALLFASGQGPSL